MRFALFLIAFSALALLTAQSLPEQQVPADPVRDSWQKPDAVIAALNFSPTETIAVIENGYPYFAPRIAPYVKQVYSVNADPRAFTGRGAPPASVSTIVGNFQNPQLGNLKLDTVMMVDMLQFLPNHPSYFLLVAAGLRRGGRLVIIDRNLPNVIPASQKTSTTQIASALSAAGFGSLTTFTILPYQFFLVFHF